MVRGDDDTNAARSTTHTISVREIIAIFFLAITAVLTAWCGFQAAKWIGAMAIAFNEAAAERIIASDALSESRDARSLDVAMYTRWVEAIALDQKELSDYLEQQFTPAFAVAFADWTAGGQASPSPFSEGSYQPDGEREAADHASAAEALFADRPVFSSAFLHRIFRTHDQPGRRMDAHRQRGNLPGSGRDSPAERSSLDLGRRVIGVRPIETSAVAGPSRDPLVNNATDACF